LPRKSLASVPGAEKPIRCQSTGWETGCLGNTVPVAVGATLIHLMSKPTPSGLELRGRENMDNKPPVRWELDDGDIYVQYEVEGADVPLGAVIWWLIKLAAVVVGGTLAVIYVAGLIWS